MDESVRIKMCMRLSVLSRPEYGGREGGVDTRVIGRFTANSRAGGWSINFDGLPLLPIGTFNKPTMYVGPMLLEVHYRFRKILKDTDALA